MDDNTTQVLVLLITTLGTIAVAWIRMRQPHHQQPSAPPPPADPGV